MSQQTIVAYFDSRSDAQGAMDALVSSGLDRSAIRLLPEAESGSYKRSGSTSSYDHERDEGGFWASLGDTFMPDEDRYAYAEGFSRGGVALVITADGARLDGIQDIAARHGAVDMDEREASWRSEGWAGYQGPAGASGGMNVAGGRAAADLRGEETIPVVEEQIRIGKRQVSGGHVRIRAYTVETPVQEQVSLRSERVFVERRPVDRALTAADDPAFAERTIEAVEHAEEAVVSKDARIKEELVVHRDQAERTETVSDTVRRTEVEVTDERADADRRGGMPTRR